MNKDYVYVAYNFYSSREKLALPKLKKGMKWYAVCDSTLKEPFYDTPVLCENQQYADVSPQSVYILIGSRREIQLVNILTCHEEVPVYKALS